MAGDEGPTTEQLRQLVERVCEQAAASSNAMLRLAAVLRLRCEECGAGWSDPGERWRAYRVDDEPPELALYCPECAEFEFGP